MHPSSRRASLRKLVLLGGPCARHVRRLPPKSPLKIASPMRQRRSKPLRRLNCSTRRATSSTSPGEASAVVPPACACTSVAPHDEIGEYLDVVVRGD